MKKKYILAAIAIVIIIVLAIIFVFDKKDKEPDELTLNREKLIKALGTTDERRVVIKRLDKEKEEAYYVFEIKDMQFEQYSYRFFYEKADYDEWVETYQPPNYRLETNESALMVKVYAQSGNRTGEETIYESIINSYKDNDKYEIIK